VYIHNFPHSFLPLIFKIHSADNLVVHWHGTDIFEISKFSFFLNKASYYFIKNVKKHFVPSLFFAKEVSKKLNIPLAEIIISPSGGVDTDVFYPIKKSQDELSTITLGYASSLLTEKGIDYVIRLIEDTRYLEQKTDKTIKFILINYGADSKKYTDVLKKFNNVSLINTIHKSNMNSFYNRLNVLLLPTRLNESLALVGLEAMSCNIPVVGTNDFAIKNYIKSGISGEKFTKNKYDSFQKAVIKTINNINDYKPRDIVLREYSKQHVVEQYRNYFS